MVDINKVAEDFNAYRAPSGLISGSPGNESQNGVMFTVEAAIIKKHLAPGLALDSTSYNAIWDLEGRLGLFLRAPKNYDANSFDNMIAHIAFMNLYTWCGWASAEYVLKFGREAVAKTGDTKLRWLCWLLGGFRTRYFWNPANPSHYTYESWHGRSPAYMALLRHTADGKMNLWRTICILVGQFLEPVLKPKSEDSWRLTYITWQWLKNRSKFWRFFYNQWCRLLLRQYPGGMKDVYADYFQNPDNPIVKYSPAFVP